MNFAHFGHGLALNGRGQTESHFRFLRRKEIAMRKEGVALYALIFAALLTFTFAAFRVQSLLEENAQLKQQLERKGLPIDIGKLPDGTYFRVDDNRFAIVMKDVSGDLNPYFAIFAKDGNIPNCFSVKDTQKHTADVFKENPTGKKPAIEKAERQEGRKQ
jgi:hypothetical protein